MVWEKWGCESLTVWLYLPSALNSDNIGNRKGTRVSLQRCTTQRYRTGSAPSIFPHPFSSTSKTPAVMLTERELQISPIVQESVLHNTKVRPLPCCLASSLSALRCSAQAFLSHCPSPSFPFRPVQLHSASGLDPIIPTLSFSRS